jgi:hypothetical protein
MTASPPTATTEKQFLSDALAEALREVNEDGTTNEWGELTNFEDVERTRIPPTLEQADVERLHMMQSYDILILTLMKQNFRTSPRGSKRSI